MGLKRILLLACLGLGTCVSMQVRAQSHLDPPNFSAERQSTGQAIQSGRLANGLRYIIIPRRSEAFQDTSKVAFRIRVDGGWPAEGPGENGLVHLIEHLPLEGNSRMSAEEVTTFRDQHTDVREWGAFTSPYASEYFLTTQTNDQSVIIDALRYLGGIAIGLPISAEGVERQRPIVINEMAGRLAEAMRLHERARVLAPTSEWDISRGYDSSDLATADLETIQALYNRVYRPENVTIVIVGDVDPSTVTELLADEFGAWAPAALAPAPRRAESAAPSSMTQTSSDDRPTGASLRHTVSLDVAAQRTVLASLRVTVPYAVGLASPTPRRDAATIDRVITLILLHRLELQALEAGLGTTDFTIAPTAADGRAFIWQLAPLSSEWRSGLAILLDQVAAANKGGFTERELATAKQILLRDIKDRSEQAILYSNGSLSASMSDSLNRGFELRSDAEALEQERRLLANLTLADLNEAWRQAAAVAPIQTRIEGFADEGSAGHSSDLTVFVDTYAPRSVELPRNGAAGIEQQASSPKPGRIVSDKRTDDGIRTLVFANGSTLRLVKREHQGKYLEIEVRASAPQTRGELTLCDALILPHFVYAGGTTMQSERDRRDALWGKDIRSSPFEMTSDGIRTGVSARIEDAAVALQDLFSIMSSPGFRDSGEKVAAGRARDALSASSQDPLIVLTREIEGRAASGKEIRSVANEEPCASSASMARASAYLRPVLTQGRIDAAVAGNMNESDVIALFASTFGQDQRRKAKPAAAGPANHDKLATLNIDMIPASGGQTHVGAAWTIKEPANGRERAAQEMLTALFARMLYVELAQNGTVYAPNVARLELIEHKGQPIILAAATVPAVQAEGVLAAISKVAEGLATSGPEPQLLETIRGLMVNGVAETYNQDRMWAFQAAQLSSRPRAVEIWRSAAVELQTVSSGDIQELAREIFAVPFAQTRLTGTTE
jgi:zinc protease